MIVTDLDGTLLAGKSNLPEENIAALRRAMDAGVHVVLASGRMVEATLPIAEKIGVNAPMVLFNGAQVYDMREDRILFGKRIPLDVARRVLREIEKTGIHVNAFPGKGYVFERENEWTEYYVDKIGVVGKPVGCVSEWVSTDLFKLLCLAPHEKLIALQKQLEPMFPELSFVKSGETHLEIIAQGIDKATGLAFLADYLGVARDEMMSFGDEMNDLPIIEFAGTGYAMGNSVPDVLKRAKYIAPRNTECGVARIVNLFLDEGRMGGGNK